MSTLEEQAEAAQQLLGLPPDPALHGRASEEALTKLAAEGASQIAPTFPKSEAKAKEAELPTLKTISIECEIRGDSATLFRIKMDDALVAESITAEQTNSMIGDLLENIASYR